MSTSRQGHVLQIFTEDSSYLGKSGNDFGLLDDMAFGLIQLLDSMDVE